MTWLLKGATEVADKQETTVEAAQPETKDDERYIGKQLGPRPQEPTPQVPENVVLGDN